MTTSKIVTDNDAKNEEMRFLRFVSLHLNPHHYASATEQHGPFKVHALNSSALIPRWNISSVILLSPPMFPIRDFTQTLT